MDSLTPSFWLSALALLWSIGLTVAVALRKPGEEAASALASYKTEQDKLRREDAVVISRLQAESKLLEERMKHLPTHGDIRQLLDKVSDMGSKLNALTDIVQSQRATLELIQEFMHRDRGQG